MATTTTMMWTVLPNGGTAGAFKFSIYLSPQLTGMGSTGMLQDYALGNWTRTVRELASSEELFAQLVNPLPPFLPSPTVRLRIPREYTEALDPTFWATIFPPRTTQVVPWTPHDQSRRWLRSFSLRPLEDYIQGLYDTLANSSATTFPDLKGTTPVTQLVDLVQQSYERLHSGIPGPRTPDQKNGGFLPKQYAPVPQATTSVTPPRATHPEAALEATLNSLAASAASASGGAVVPLGEMFRAYRFFRRGNDLPYAHRPPVFTNSPGITAPTPAQYDFHKTLASMGDYPFLLRKLGLIIDCLLPVPAVALTGQNTPVIRAIRRAVPRVTDTFPWTRYMVSGTVGFRPQPRSGSDLSQGMLRLDPKGDYDIFQTDPDGNVIKVFDYAVSMGKVRSTLLAQKTKNPQATSSQKPEETSVPALRSGGFMVARLNRDNKVWDNLHLQSLRLTANLALTANALTADDVLRGYRFDVRYQGKWYSLSRRSGQYQIGTLPPLAQPQPDEGYVKSESASSDPDAAPLPTQQPDLYLHESLAVWKNWSLTTRPTGNTIVPVTDPMTGSQREVTQPQQNVAPPGFNIAVNFKAEKTSLPPLRYGETYQFRCRAVDLAGNSLGPPPSPAFPTAVDEAPAGVGISQPVTYLRFDPVPAPVLVPTSANTAGESVQTMVIRNRSTYAPQPFPVLPTNPIDEGAEFNPGNSRWVAPPKSTIGQAEAHKKFDDLFKDPPTLFSILKSESGSFDDAGTGTQVIGADGTALPPNPPGTPLPAGAYTIHTESAAALPYLPDPLAHGAAFMPLAPSGAPTGEVDYRGYDTPGGPHWPANAPTTPFRLQLAEGPGVTATFVAGSAGNPGSFMLPRGTMLTVRFASAIAPPGAADPGELALMARWSRMTVTGRSLATTNKFQHWMITPWRTLTLVHAVEKPMAPPNILTMADPPPRGFGDTFAHVEAVDVQLDAPSTGEIEVRGRWNEFTDDPADTTAGTAQPVITVKDSHALNRQVDYADSPATRGTNHLFISPAVPPTTNIPPDVSPRHEFGDTKHRFVKYRAIGTTRYREYFKPNLTGYVDPATKAKLITVEGSELQVNVKSSARPAPPDVEYIVPTFKWIDNGNGRTRQGRGLRVYLKRGWFSSGEGELLGVVLMPAGAGAGSLTDPLRDYVSLWGSDPIFDRKGPASFVGATDFVTDSDFPNVGPVHQGNNLSLAEINQTVSVQGFAPQYDVDRQLWFVDLQMALPSAYYTFIRLALCRYQPDSLAGVELSKVVRAEMAQLLPDRSASVSQTQLALAVTVAGQAALSKLGETWIGGAPNGLTAAAGTGLEAAPAGNRAAATSVNLPPPTNGNGPPILIPILVPNAQAGSGHLVTATIEWRPADSNSDVNWTQLDATTLQSYTQVILGGGTVYWQGTVRWPRAGLPAGRDWRLVLRELEIYQTDADVAESLPVDDPNRAPVRSRLVYVDVFPLEAPPGNPSGQ